MKHAGMRKMDRLAWYNITAGGREKHSANNNFCNRTDFMWNNISRDYKM